MLPRACRLLPGQDLDEVFALADHVQLAAGAFLDGRDPGLEILDFGLQGVVARGERLVFLGFPLHLRLQVAQAEPAALAPP